MNETSTLPAGQPRLTLGFGVLKWASKYLQQPDGPQAGQRWRFTLSQVRFVLWFYAVNERGRWLHHRGALRWSKGRGKSPMLAALSLTELCGPVVFDGFDESVDGGCVGRSHPMPWVQIAAVSKEQTKNTMTMVAAMAPKSSRLVREYRLDVGKEITYIPGGGRLEITTSSAHTAEGNRPTFVVADETEHWLPTGGGHELADTLRRNLGKTGGRQVESSNAFVPGEDSVAERTCEAWRAQVEGRARSAGVLYDAVEAPADTDMADEDSLRSGLAVAYADADWVDMDRIVAEIYDPSTPPSVARRYYLNQLAAATDSWLSQPEWVGCFDVEKLIADKDVITLGFDGSRGRSKGVTDATALIGCRVADGHLFELGVWEQPDGPTGANWQVPVAEVEAAVRMAFDRYRVAGFYCDPSLWETQVAAWEAAYSTRLQVKASRSRPCSWHMAGGRSTLTVRATEQLHNAVVEREITHDGSYALTRHVLNARRRATAQGIQIHKEHPDSARKIDAAIAAILAFTARTDAIAAGALNQQKSRRIHRY